MSRAAHTFLGFVVLLVLAGCLFSIVFLAWLVGSDFTEFPRVRP